MKKVLYSPLQAFRMQTGREQSDRSLPVNKREKLIIGIVLLQLIVVSWGFGGNSINVQYITLGLSFLSALCTFVPFSKSKYAYKLNSDNHFRANINRLISFPVFWLGFILMIYISIQGWNSSDQYISIASIQLIEPLPYIEWLPSGIDAPIKKMNAWRVMIMLGSVWLTVCVFWIIVRTRRSIVWLFWAMAINVTLLAIVSVLHNLDYPKEMLWLVKRPQQEVFGPFLYVNHASAYLNTGLILLQGLFLYHFKNNLKRGQRSNPGVLLIVMTLVVFGAVFISVSRGGVIIASSLMIIFITLTAIMILRLGSYCHFYFFIFATTIMACCLSALFYISINKQRFIKEFENLTVSLKNVKEDYRYNINQTTIKMIEDRWLWGWGAGSYSYYFPQYQKENPVLWRKIEGRRPFVKYAHNDWLQYLVELGVAGFGLILAIFLYWALQFIKHYKQMDFIHWMVCLGSLLLLFYAFIDFPFYNLSVLLTFSVVVVGAAKLLGLRKIPKDLSGLR